MLMYFVLTAMGFILFAICIVGLIWSIRSGQMDDLESPAVRMLHDDTIPPPSK